NCVGRETARCTWVVPVVAATVAMPGRTLDSRHEPATIPARLHALPSLSRGRRLTRRRWDRGRTNGAGDGSELVRCIGNVPVAVANILAPRHVDDVLADVLGMVANALERTHDPQEIQRATDRSRVFHHEGDALSLNRLELLVEEVVPLGHGDR